MINFYTLERLNQVLLFKLFLTTCLTLYFFCLLGINILAKLNTNYVPLYFVFSLRSLFTSLRISPFNTVQNALKHFQGICCSGFKLSFDSHLD